MNHTVISKKLLKTLLLFTVGILLSPNAWSQALGDFRSLNAVSDWSSAGNWETWNGGAWVAAIEYPGQTPGNANLVTVRDGHTLSLTADIPNPIGALTIGEGASGILTSDHASNTRILNVTGDFTGTANSQTLLRGISLTVNGATSLDGILTDDNDAGVVTFTGLLTVGATGAFNTSALTTTTNLNIGAGIANAGNVTISTANFTGTGPVSGAGSYTISGNLLVTGAVTVTNSVSDLTVGGTLDGTVGGSTWINDANTTFRYEHATAPMTTGTLTANNANSNFYYSLAGDQAIKDGAYLNLFFTGGGTKNLTTGNITAGGTWELATGVTFNPAANDFSVTGATTLAGTIADSDVNGTITLADADISGGTIDGTATGVVNITGAVTLPTANPIIGRATLTLSSTITIPTGRTVTLNANSNTGVKTFSTITVNGGGVWNSSNISTKSNLVIGTAYNSGGSTTFGGATFGAGATLTDGSPVTFPNGADGLGTLTLAVGGAVDFQDASNITTNLVSGAGTSTIFSGGNSSIGGTYNVEAGQTGTVSTAGTFSAGASTFEGAFVDNDNTAATTFTGLVTIGAAGSFTTSSVTTTTNLNLGAGIANAGTVTMPTANFTGTGPISGAGTYTISGNLLVTGAVTVTNSVSDLTVGGTIDGTVGGSTWINDVNTTFRYEHATAPMATGTLTANNNNSNFYYSLNGAQAIKAGSYYNLLMTVGGTKTSTGNITVGNDWTLASGVTFDPDAGDFDVTGASTLAGTLADGNVAGTTTLAATDLSGGTIDGAATGVVNITGAVTLPTANPTIGRATLTLTNALTIPTGRTVTFNANATTGVKTFGTVTVNGGGTWNSSLLTTKANLVISTAFNDAGSTTFGGATFGAGATLTSGSNVNFPNGADGAGTLNLAVTGTVDFQDASVITTNLVSGAGTSTTFSGGNSSIGGTYNVEAGQTGTVSTAGTFSAGASTFEGAFVDNDNTAATTFTGLVTVGAAGSFTTSSVTTTTNLNLGAGIANAGTVTMPTANFTGTGPISGAGTYTISGNLLVTGAVTVTNSVSDLTVGGTIDGTVGGSTWINDVNTTFRYEHATAPMATGTLTANNNNSNFYYSLNGAQAIKAGSYYNLLMTVGGTKTSTGNITVGNDWTLASGVTFDPDAGDFDVTGASTLAGTLADGNVAGTTTLAATDLSGGTIDGAATGVVNITGAVTLPTADPTIGRATLTLSNTLTIPTGRTVTFNANAPTGVKTFGTVVVDNGGTWTSTLLNTKPSLVVNTAFTNNGTASFGGATFGAGALINSVTGITFPNGADGSGNLTLNLNPAGTVDFQDASTISGNLVSGANTSTTFSGGNSSITGTYNVEAGQTGTVSSTGTFSAGASTFEGAFLDNDNTAATTFTGLVTVGAAGSFTTSSVTTTTNLNLGAGIANAGTVTMPTANFTGTGPISGAGTYTISGNLLVTGAVTVTNQVTDLTVGGTLDGTAGGSTWINDVNTTFRYEHATAPMATGILTANNLNSNFYYSLNGAQSVKTGTYYNLFFTTGGTKTTTGLVTATNDWTLASGVTFDPAANDFGVGGTTTLAGTLADSDVAGTTALSIVDMSGGTIDGPATGVVTISSTVTMPTANPTIGRVTLTATGGTLTIPNGRTITFNANSPTGVKTFSTVVVDNGGTWNSTLLTTKSNLVVSTAFTNNGTSTFGGADISGTLTSVNGLSFPNGLDAAAALQADITGTLTTAAASIFASDLTLGATTIYTMNGAVNNSVGGNLNVANGTDLIVANTGTFDVTGTTQIDGDFIDNDNTAATSFTGLITIGATGTFTSSAVTTLGNMNFAGGIANAGTFTSDDANFNGTQTVSGAGTFTIGGDLMVDGAVTVTNQIPDMTVSGVFNGNNAASTWINDVNTTFRYRNATEPMATGILNANNNNSNFHYDLAGDQDVKDGQYYNLLMENSGTKTLIGNVTANNDWTLATGVTFNPVGFDFTVTNASTLAGTHQDSNAGGTTTLNSVDLSGGTIDGTATGVVNINGAITMPTVATTVTIGRATLTCTNTLTVPNTATFNFNANSPTGVKTFGDVVVSPGATWNSAVLNTPASLVVTSSFDNQFNQTTFGGATINGTLTSVIDLDFPDGLDATAPLTVNATGTITVSTAGNNYDCSYDDLTLGSSTVMTFLGGNNADPTINGNLVVGVGTSLNVSNNRDFNIIGTSSISGTITRTNNGAAAQDMSFGGVVTVNSGGTLNMSAISTDDRLYFAAGLDNDGTCDFGTARVRFGAGSVLTARSDMTFPDGLNCLVGGSLTIAGPGTVFDQRINSSTVFNGQLIIAANGSYDSRTRILQSDVYFEAGIEQNNTTDTAFVISRARFSVADQALTGAGNIYILDDVRVDNNRTVTNNNTGNVVVGVSTGRIDAQNGGSTWIQGPNSNLIYAGTVRPMDAGVLDASGVGNTVTYNTTALTQDVKQSTYYNLIFSPANNADAFGAMTVTNQLTLTSGTFQNDAFLTMGNNATISRGQGSLNAAPTFGANVNIIYTANLATSFEMPAAGATTAAGVLDNLTFNTAGAEVTISSPISVKGNMTWTTDAIVNMIDNDVRFGTGTISGNGTNAYLKTNGTGKFVKEGSSGADFQMTYPLGTTFYTPVQVTAITAGAGVVNVRAIGSPLPYKDANKNGIAKYWEISNTAGASGVDATFTFNPAEVVGSVTNYEPQVGNGATHAAVTGPSANGTTPTFSMTGHPTFTGDFTYIDATIQTPKTFYSFQSGDWNDPTCWSTTPLGWTNSGTEYPGGVASGDSAVVRNAHNLTGNISIIVKGVNIQAGGIVDVGTQTGHIITNLNGQGKIRLNSLTLPTVTNNSGFVAAGGGTVEYYNIGGAGSNLSTNWMTYNNLTISNNTGTNHLLILQNQTNPSTYVLNGTLSLEATGAGTTTLQMGFTATNIIDLSIGGNLNLTSNAFFTVGSFDAIHTVRLTGNINNEGTIDWCNTAQYQQFVNINSGAARLIATGASDKLYTCNGPTDVFQLQLYLGTDATYVCEINPSVAANWRVFSLRPQGGGHGGSDNPNDYNFDHAYFIDKGTLKFNGASNISALGRQNAQYLVEEGDRIWLAGGTMDLSVPGISDGTIRMTREGELKVTGGTLTMGDDGFNFQDRGIIKIEGGTVNVTRLMNMYPGDGDAAFVMSGGTLNLRAVDAEGSRDLPRFQWTNSICSFTQSGGTVNVYDPMSTVQGGDAAQDGGTLAILSAASSVTGGTWNFYLPASNVDMKIALAVPLYNVNVYKQGAGTSRLLLSQVAQRYRIVQKRGLTILNNLTIDGTNNPIFDANGEAITVGGDINIVNGGTLQGASQTIFTGSNASTFTIGSTQSHTTDLSIQKTGAGSVTMAGAATFDCVKNLEVTGGTFDIGATVPFDVAGNISNAGTIQGAEQLRMQRGVVTANVTGGAYTMPTVTAGGAGATFNLTVKDGRIIDVDGSGGAGYGNNNRLSMTIGGTGAGAVIRCRTTNNIDSCWVVSEGSGYGPTVAVSGGGGTGATAAAILTGDQGAAATLTIETTNPGKGYTSPATYTLTGGGTADDVTVAPNISGGTFSNLSLNNYQGATATSALTLTGNLRLASGVLSMSQYALNLGTASNIYDGLAGTGTTFDNTKMISTAGLTSNGGVVKAFNGLCFLYPVGIGANYMEENLCFSGAPTTYGSITVKPVAGEHPLVSANGQSLTAYWSIRTAGTVLGAATVSHTFKYPDAYVVDNGGTVLESEYVPGRFNSTTTSWDSDAAQFVTAGTNTGTANGANFNTQIDGDFTFGDKTPSDPFASVFTFYSRDGGGYDYNTAADWSITAHNGAASVLTPTSSSVVKIGDGVTYNHTMTVGTNGMAAGFITIAPGSTLDLGTTTGHNFGTYTSAGANNGTMRIASAGATAEFPAGDFANLLDATGGTVEYYTTGAQSFTIPATSAAPSSAALTQYRNLILTPATGDNITMPDVDLTIHEDYTVQGASATGLVNMNSVTARAMAIGQDFKVTSGNAQFKNGTVQAVTVGRNVEVSAGAILDVENGGATANTLEITGDLVNDGTINFNQSSKVNLTFVGTGNTSISGTTGGAVTTINNLTVNKGTDQTAVLDVTVQGTFTPPTNDWLTLTNGTFRLSIPSAISLIDQPAVAGTPVTNAFYIPGTTCFSVNNAGATVRMTSALNGGANINNNNDVYLGGKLEIIDGSVIIGVGTTNRGQNNDIEYASTGTPTVDIQNGSLYVNGQIRRDVSVAAGDLNWNQTGGTVTIGGRRSTANKGKFEILNNGVFNMSDGTIILNMPGNLPTTFVGLADMLITPASSTVTGGTIQFGITGDNAHNNTSMTLRSSVPLHNIVVDGNAGDTVAVQVSVAPLTINGTLTIANEFSAFDCNGADLIFTQTGNLVNNHTSALVGVTSGGFYPGVATQNTTFSSTTAAQTITGTGANISNFGNLTINNTFGNVSLVNNDIAVNGNLTITTTLADGGQTVNTKKTILNNGTHSGAGSIALNGTSQQTIGGTGTFQNLQLNNTAGALASSNINVEGTFTIDLGVLELAARRLILGTAANFATNTAYSSTAMISTNGSLSDLGIRKNFPIGAFDITYPIGVGAKYTPVRHNVTANTATGVVTVKPIDLIHPSTQDPGAKELTYYWNVFSTGFAGLSVDQSYTYVDSDINGTETNYNAGCFVGSDWTPTHGYAGTVNAATNTMTIPGLNFLTADWTAGESDGVTHFEFIPLVTYYSRQTGPWNDVNTWSTDAILQHTGAPAAVIPAGNPIVIGTGHDVTVTTNSKVAPSVIINGTGSLDLAATFGHTLGTVSGDGKLRASATVGGTFFLPVADFSAFVADGTGGTWEYYGTNTGTLPAQLEYNNLMFTGASTKRFALGDVTINGSFTINSGIVDNTLNNVNLTIEEDWTNSTGPSGFLPGTGTVTMTSSTNRSMTGSTVFRNLTVNNTGGTVTVTGGKTVNGILTMTNGLLDFGADTLTLGVTATIAGSPFSAAKMIQTGGAYTDGGVMMNCNTNPRSITLPIGSGGLYTPASYNITAAGASGTINVRPVAAVQPFTNDVNNLELTYYWNVRSTGLTGLTLSQTYTYDQSDVQGTEGNYRGGHIPDSLDWSPLNGHVGSVNTATNVISIPSGNVVNGDYTAGESDGVTTFEFGPAPTYYSRTTGNWADVNSWSVDAVLQHTGAPATVLPRGNNPMVIGNGHQITTAANDVKAKSVEIAAGGEVLIGTTTGHNFRDLNGTGTMRVNCNGGSYTLPLGNYSDFKAVTGGTINYISDCGNSVLPDSLTYCGLELTGGNTITIPAIAGLTLNGTLTITGTVLDNSGTNIPIGVKGNWTNGVGFTGYVPGTETVTFDGTAAQVIDGENNFGSIGINNSTGVTIDDSVNVAGTLAFTTGIVSLTKNMLLMQGGPGNISGYGPTAYVATNDTARLKIPNVAAVQTPFPVGTIGANKYAPVFLTNSGDVGAFWVAATDSVRRKGTVGPALADTAFVNEAVNKTWYIKTDAAVPSVNITLTWHTSQELPAFTRNHCSVQKHYNKGNSWDWRVLNNYVAFPLVPLTPGYFTATVNGVATFSPFAVGLGDKALPVDLLSFTASKANKNVKVLWSTGSEINNAGYEVERSLDGVSFIKIGTVKGKTNSYETSTYSLIDSEPHNGLNYYRLKQIDLDGKITYSNIVVVDMSHTSKNEEIISSDVSLFPNPVAPDKSFNLEFTNLENKKEILVIVMDVTGREFYSKVVPVLDNENQIIAIDPTRRLEPGIYIITGSVDNNWYNKKLIVK